MTPHRMSIVTTPLNKYSKKTEETQSDYFRPASQIRYINLAYAA
jgi:hypothetical protein